MGDRVSLLIHSRAAQKVTFTARGLSDTLSGPSGCQHGQDSDKSFTQWYILATKIFYSYGMMITCCFIA